MLMTARMTNPAFAVPGAMDALNAVSKTISRARVPISRELVHLRASQINGCSVCAREGGAPLRGERGARVRRRRVARDALLHRRRACRVALTEALTRIADRAEQVPDEIWDAAAEHFDEVQLGALVLDIATVNLWNRLNIATQQVVGEHSG